MGPVDANGTDEAIPPPDQPGGGPEAISLKFAKFYEKISIIVDKFYEIDDQNRRSTDLNKTKTSNRRNDAFAHTLPWITVTAYDKAGDRVPATGVRGW